MSSLHNKKMRGLSRLWFKNSNRIIFKDMAQDLLINQVLFKVKT